MREIRNKTNAMLRLESQYSVNIEELLRRKYVDEGLTIDKLARQLIISRKTAWNWLKEAGITCRRMKWE